MPTQSRPRTARRGQRPRRPQRAKRSRRRRGRRQQIQHIPLHRPERNDMTSTDQTNLAFLGLGTMGAAMAANLARAGFPLTAWNRTPGRAPELRDLGVDMAETPAAAVADADVAVICVSDTPDVEAILFGPAGVVEGARPGTLIIDCSTIAPSG